MPEKSKSVLKRQRQSEEANKSNRRYKSKMKTAIRKVLESTERNEAESLYREAVSAIDTLVSKGVIHKNMAANRKSRITRYLNSLS